MEEFIEFFMVFVICLLLLSLNIYTILKIQDKIIPVLFMLFTVLIYSSLFTYNINISYGIGILFIGLSLYINVKGVEII